MTAHIRLATAQVPWLKDQIRHIEREISAASIDNLVAGANITLTESAGLVTIASTGGGGGSGTFSLDDGDATTGGTFTFDDGGA